MSQDKLSRILVTPHMSEKAAIAAEKYSGYVFEVSPKATKADVKKAVELMFKTLVKNVRIVNVKTKPKRFGQIEGRSKAWKKAYVTLQEGHQIDFGGGA